MALGSVSLQEPTLISRKIELIGPAIDKILPVDIDGDGIQELVIQQGKELLIYNFQIDPDTENKQFVVFISIGGVDQPSVRLNVPTSNRIINVPYITVVDTDGQNIEVHIDNSQGNNTQLDLKGDASSTADNITRLTTMEIA